MGVRVDKVCVCMYVHAICVRIMSARCLPPFWYSETAAGHIVVRRECEVRRSVGGVLDYDTNTFDKVQNAHLHS